MKWTKDTTLFSCFLIGNGTLLRECGNILRSQKHRILGVITSAAQECRWAEQANLKVIDRERFGVDLPLRNLFERPTVAGLAEVIDALSWSVKSRVPVQAIGDREEVEL